MPLISRYVRRVPHVSEGISEEQRGLLLRILTTLGMISEEQRSIVDAAFQNLYLILAVVFVFTPGFVTRLGCVLIGMAIPCYLSISVLGQHNNKLDVAQESVVVDRMDALLKYWITHTALNFLFSVCGLLFDWLPLWWHVNLAWVVVLQLPGVRGADRLYGMSIAAVQSAGLLRLLLFTSQPQSDEDRSADEKLDGPRGASRVLASLKDHDDGDSDKGEGAGRGVERDVRDTIAVD